MEKSDFIEHFSLLHNSIEKDTPTIFLPLEYSHDQILISSDSISIPLDVPETEPNPQESSISDVLNDDDLLDKYLQNKFPPAHSSNSLSLKPSKPKTPPDNTKSYVCELCDEVFHLPSLLRLHKRALHVLTKPYQCDKCPHQFNFEKNFLIHTASHAPTPAICPECGCRYKRSAGYRGHLITHLTNDNFRCKKCDLEFEYEDYYRRHCATSHQTEKDVDETGFRKRCRNTIGENDLRKKYGCSNCEKKFTKPSNLARHQLTHSKNKPFRCTVCQMRFTQKSSLERHSALHSGLREFKCPKCSMRFSQSGNLRSHMIRVHPTNPDLTNKFPCPDCSCIFNKLNSLNRHSAKMHSIKPTTQMDESDENYSIDNVMSQLRNLQNICYHDPESPSDNCSLFPNENVEVRIPSSPIVQPEQMDSNVENHLIKIVETLNPQEEKSEIIVNQVETFNTRQYSCSICCKNFQRPYDLLRHNRVHTNEKPYECGICGQRFAIKNGLNVHLRMHGKDGDKITKCYQCPNCFKLFNSLRQLDFHVKTHGDTKLFPCSICGKSFSSTNNLRIHQYTHRPKNIDEIQIIKTLKLPISTELQAKRSDDTPTSGRHQCSICGLQFKRAAYLVHHESRHSEVKQFQCKTCKKSFTTQSSLNTHHKIHTGHRTKACNECDAKFWSNADLKRHKFVHTTKRSVLCPYCGKSFKTNGGCRTHILTHAKDLAKTNDVTESNTFDDTNPINYEYVLVMSDQVQPTAGNSLPNNNENVLCLRIEEPVLNNESNVQLLPEQVVALDDRELSLQEQSLPLPTPRRSPLKSASFIEMHDLINDNIQEFSNVITVRSVQKQSTESAPFVLPSTPNPLPSKSQTQRLHPCDVCSKSFRKPIDLRRHLRTHTKEKPFECNICHLSFSLKCTLEKHQLIHNENREIFQCQVCGKNYASSNVLKIHLRIHTNERPFNCKYCAKTFRTSGHRITHMRTHLKLKDLGQKKRKH